MVSCLAVVYKSAVGCVFGARYRQTEMSENKIVLVTGASSGIGAACAVAFAKKNYDLILCARREERLKKLREQILMLHDISIHLASFDVSNRKMTDEFY